MSSWLEIALVLLFVLVGGFFSMSELALVSLRDSQVRALAARGGRGAAVERLRADENRFLSSVQIGVTLAGFFAASFGGAQLAGRLQPQLEAWGVPVGIAATVALVVVTILVSYASLVLGELVPKRLALQRSEGVALVVAPVLDRIATLTRPVVWVLGRSTDLVVRLIGLDPNASREEVSEEELREMVSSHEQLGAEERAVLTDVFDAADRRLGEVMIPRTEVAFLDASLGVDEAATVVEDQPHSRYPVTGESADDVLGFVHVRDLLAAARRGRGGTVRDLVRPVALLPGSKTLLPALTLMRRSGRHLAVVVDEYGGTDGIVTLEDLVEELVGEIEDEYDQEAAAGQRAGGPSELDGLLHRDEVADQTGLALPEGPYETLGGFVMTELGRVPVVGDEVEALGHRFAVVATDGRRPARIRVEPVPGEPGEPGEPGDGEAGSGSHPLRADEAPPGSRAWAPTRSEDLLSPSAPDFPHP
ncbi:hemolysin family protein [Quadrisphaera sp. DSM 44207]|uniref:hemolysin family protein n=1 Tax=Quadrisphaera sp. DSM 44207 TaxID=1881057 RepID=UPI000884B032|nr:hemolysin family protein [Quadrisphaera sp. DSM 44207]SDQ22205.1 putative hemolysin [Quadrisphaera sp. DSM 44207]